MTFVTNGNKNKIKRRFEKKKKSDPGHPLIFRVDEIEH